MPLVACLVALPGLIVAVVVGSSGLSATLTGHPWLLDTPAASLPTATELIEREVSDLTRDVVNVSNRTPLATEELEDDLAALSSAPTRASAVHLARSTSRVLGGHPLDEAGAEPIARTLRLVVRPWEWNDRTAASLHAELRALIVKSGVSDADAAGVVGEIK